ncbi:MAG: class I SAM-dependent methyltransferase [Acidobacteria bacterium]|nr:class I SAM-dependent methyltransferase [Acidobacteriota bacterium]
MTAQRITQILLPADVSFLRCPSCAGSLEPRGPEQLACAGCGGSYPVRLGIPRFIADESYAANFGYQWRLHSRTQLDRHSGLSISRDRFHRQTGWKLEELRGKRVLEVGCGAGRFTDIVLGAGAEVWAIDLSLAIEANLENHPETQSLRLIQADLHRLPFAKDSFDFVFCFGVLQHTADPCRAFGSLVPFLKPGMGRIAVDIYPRSLRFLLHPKYLLRPLTRRMSKEKLYDLIRRRARSLLALSDFLHGIPLLGKHLARLVPIANYRSVFALPDTMLLDWAVLDTFDWLSPRYDRPATLAQLRSWLHEARLTDVEALDQVVYVGRGRRA